MISKKLESQEEKKDQAREKFLLNTINFFKNLSKNLDKCREMYIILLIFLVKHSRSNKLKLAYKPIRILDNKMPTSSYDILWICYQEGKKNSMQRKIN